MKERRNHARHHYPIGGACGRGVNYETVGDQMNNENNKLLQQETWQTQSRGTNEQEYEIYKAAAESLGWAIKTYEEWIRS
jgi:hypothetical protein